MGSGHGWLPPAPGPVPIAQGPWLVCVEPPAAEPPLPPPVVGTLPLGIPGPIQGEGVWEDDPAEDEDGAGDGLQTPVGSGCWLLMAFTGFLEDRVQGLAGGLGFGGLCTKSAQAVAHLAERIGAGGGGRPDPGRRNILRKDEQRGTYVTNH